MEKSSEQKQVELLEYYREQHKNATFSGYKQHFRQMIMLLEKGRTAADGKTIVLDSQMLDNLWFFYETTKTQLNPSEMGKKGGAKSRGGGRPLKIDADPKRRARYLASKEKKN